MEVLLASKSPRRYELLKTLVPDFKVETYPSDENYVGLTPEETVIEIARRKLVAVPLPERYDVVISCDTLVYKDGKYYGKPVDFADAVRMLTELEGKTHVVVSGLWVWHKGTCSHVAERSYVTFKHMSEDQIKEYLDTHYCLDKAGAYAVQDGVVVSSLDGSYTNVMGLPTEALKKILDDIGYKNAKA